MHRRMTHLPVLVLLLVLTRVFGADLASLVPDGRLNVVEESGHIIHEEQPAVVAQTITAVVNAVHDPGTWEASATPEATS